jgi:hypothetical protein
MVIPKVFLILFFIVILILAKVFSSKSTRPNLFLLRPQTAVVPYNQFNLVSPHNVCPPNYANLAIPLKILGNDPVPNKFYDGPITLEINNFGEIVYTLNGIMTWNSKTPRKIINSIHYDSLKTYAVNTPVEKWETVAKLNEINFHIKPLAITRNNAVVWSFFSGWDITSACDSIECELNPLSVNGHGIILLISNSKKYRLALLPNLDLTVVEVKATELRGTTLETVFKSSLLKDACL